MPTVTRTMIKSAMVYALAGMALSALWLVHRVVPLHPLLAHVQPTAIHLVVVGWLTQLIFGIALWMFPPWSKTQPRGPEQVNWACYGLLNAGLLLRLVVEPLNGRYPGTLLGWLLVLSALLQVSAIWLFVWQVWIRVRGKSGGR